MLYTYRSIYTCIFLFSYPYTHVTSFIVLFTRPYTYYTSHIHVYILYPMHVYMVTCIQYEGGHDLYQGRVLRAAGPVPVSSHTCIFIHIHTHTSIRRIIYYTTRVYSILIHNKLYTLFILVYIRLYTVRYMPTWNNV